VKVCDRTLLSVSEIVCALLYSGITTENIQPPSLPKPAAKINFEATILCQPPVVL
jgi:hypothetical protein